MWRANRNSSQPILRGALVAALVLCASSAVAAQGSATSPATAQPVARAAQRRIVISLPDRKLALLEDGRVVKVYPIAVGAPQSPSPTGTFQIVNRLTDPTYYSPGLVIPPGKANPLGTRWMGFSAKRFGIHGTNEPQSIGRDASHGCIRMRNRDVEELFELIRVGDTVEVIGERSVELAALLGAPATPAAPVAKPVAPAAPVVVATVAVP